MNVAAREFSARNQCPLCRSGDLKDHMALDGIRTATCAACEFTFSRDTLQFSEIDRFYVDGYHDRRHMDGQRVNATINVELLRHFRPDLSGVALLDIGSGYGFFLDKLRDSGARRIVGVELSQAQRKYSTEQLHLETLGQMDDLSRADQFDVITVFEVIEHIPEPREFVQRAIEHLKPGGSLIIGTDNFTSDVVRVLGQQFPKWIPHEHVSFFNSVTLKGMLEQSAYLKLAAVRSFTPWELLLRKLLFRATAGRKGGKTYSYDAERGSDGARGYRFFPLRMAANRIWFRMTSAPNLDGEMMFIHMIKR